MSSDPEPNKSGLSFDGQRSIAASNASGPVPAYFLKLKRSMMDDVSKARSFCLRSVELLEAIARIRAKNLELQNASQLFTTAYFEVRECFIGELVEFARRCVSRNLPVPCVQVELVEPSAKLGPFLGRKFGYRLFEFLHGRGNFLSGLCINIQLLPISRNF